MKKFSTTVSRIIPYRNWLEEENSSSVVNIFAKLKPVLGDRILIIGCADGEIGRLVKSRGCSVVGIDNNVAMIEIARQNGIDARLMNGENLLFKDEFDGVISYSALQWMRHPDKVIDGVYGALKAGGRYVGELGAYGNIDKVITVFLEALDKRGIDGFYLIPWYFPSVDDYNRRLKEGGFVVQDIEETIVDEELPEPLEEWVRGRVGEVFAAALPEASREKFFDEVAAGLKSRLRDYGKGPILEYRVLCFNAVKPKKD